MEPAFEDGPYSTPVFAGRKRPWASYVPGLLALRDGRLGYSDHRGRVRFDVAAATLTLGELADKAARFDLTMADGKVWVCRFWDRSAYPARPVLRGPLNVAVTGFDTTDRWEASDIATGWWARLAEVAEVAD